MEERRDVLAGLVGREPLKPRPVLPDLVRGVALCLLVVPASEPGDRGDTDVRAQVDTAGVDELVVPEDGRPCVAGDLVGVAQRRGDRVAVGVAGRLKDVVRVVLRGGPV